MKFNIQKAMAEGSKSCSDDPSPKPRGGWRAVKYILANETFEKLASMSVVANMTVYLKTKYNMDGLLLVNDVSIWSGSNSFTSIGGAVVSDTWLGRYLTLLFASSSSLMGMVIFTLTAAVPKLRPPTCIDQISCVDPKLWQLSIVYAGFAFMAIGAGGIRPCNIAFGAVRHHNEERKSTTRELLQLVVLLVYIFARDSANWGCLRSDQHQLAHRFSHPDRLPFGIGCFMTMDQQNTIGILQAIQTNNTMGSSFKVPPGWLGLSSMIGLAIWIFIYEMIWVLQTKRITGKAKRLSMVQRINIGLVCAMACSIVAAVIEKQRRKAALQYGSFQSPMSIVMLLPQFSLSGLVEAFVAVAVMEYLTTQLPESVRTVAGAIFFISLSVASFLNSILVNIVHQVTKRTAKTTWLGGHDLNRDKLENFYYLVAAIEALNFIYFNVFARRFIINDSIVKTESSEGLHKNQDQTSEVA
ncbi:Protein NRT1/ PTR FAMILY 2.8 [Hibiscus syriacus]|uniref:Protein NRT1/ PTR FAMILY 2.8 n=1 Tax=Hibiscus syriacus TaxID=106335 RepID=A0A6A3CK29_HIBSY|nr:Protein NRT1/ PTR FAMILY 2.8 [Hibiscus syriacus]